MLWPPGWRFGSGTNSSSTKAPPGARRSATAAKQRTRSSWVGRGWEGGEAGRAVEAHVDEREAAVDGQVGEVADGDGDGLAARLGPQPLDHGRRGVDAVDLDAPGRQGQGPPAGG